MTLSQADEVAAYLGEPLLPRILERLPSDETAERALHEEDVALIVERTADVAARLGYELKPVCRGQTSPLTRSQGAEITTAVHSSDLKNRCAILVPAIRYIEPECEDLLLELERRGYAVKRLRGCSPIDHARSILATAMLDAGFDETMWIDADTAFDVDAVDRLRSHSLPIVAGIYARRGPRRGLAVAPFPGTSELTMGDGGGLVEVLYAGAGFLLVRREVYENIRGRFSLPLCDEHRSSRAVPFFMPMLEDWGGRMSYLGEDYAFSRSARLCGYKIMADTAIRL